VYDEPKRLIEALELEKNGDWDEAHSLVQEMSSRDGCLVHAYLHRKEGDIGNAQYWYRRAASSLPKVSLEEEWLDLYQQYTEHRQTDS